MAKVPAFAKAFTGRWCNPACKIDPLSRGIGVQN